MKSIRITLWALLIISSGCAAAEATVIRLGILPFGTVNWELTALKNSGLAKSDSFRLEIQHIANPQAGKIALQAGAVDMIVSDWIWVSRQRSTGSDLTFFPYSNTAGALIVKQNSPIHDLKDLKGRSLGIAGGELDKNWLLLQALFLKKFDSDLDQLVTKVFAAPPLLNQQLIQGRTDAIMNYWHYAARLEAQGYRQIINGTEILKSLGISATVPSLGYVFNRGWGVTHQLAINQFLLATQKAKNLLCESDAAWQDIIPLTKTETAKTQQLMRQRYCAGRVNNWGENEQQAAEQIYKLLKQLSHNRLTGISETLPPGTFWQTY